MSASNQTPDLVAAEDPSDAVVSRVRSRLAGVLAARQAVFYLTGFLFACGVAVVVVRQIGSVDRSVLSWGLLGAAPAVAIGAWMGLRRLPTRPTIHAMIDQHNRCGGLLVAEAEADTSAWSCTIGPLSGLSVRWACGRGLGAMLVGLVFVAGAFAMPGHLVSPSPSPLDVSRQVDELREQIDLLAVEQIIEEPDAHELRERVAEVGQQARGQDPAKTWEAIDHLNDLVAREADEAAEQALRMSQQLQEARTLDDAITRGGDAMNPQLRQQAMAELAQQLESLAELSPQMPSGPLDAKMLDQLAAQARELGLDAQQAKELAEMLAGQQEKIKELMQRLTDAGMIDPDRLSQCIACDKVDGDGLAQFLAEQGGQGGQGGQGTEKMGVLLSAFCAGRGGTDQDGGLTDMTWRNATTEDGAGFVPEVLPPSSLEAMLNSHTLGTSQRNPETDAEAPGSSGGALTGARAGGGSGTTQQILPRHRQAVRDYFEREAPDDGSPPVLPSE